MKRRKSPVGRSRRVKSQKFGLNTSLITEVIGASLIVQQAPKLLRSLLPTFPMEGMIGTLAGVGSGYIVGSFLKKPNLQNASIALGAVEVIAPIFDDLLGGSTPPVTSRSIGPSGMPMKYNPGKNSAIPAYKNLPMADFLNLNDYVSAPEPQINSSYRDSY